ncbi:MAG: ThuA domain-containing protein [Proteobacteria bacterium]|nr:ThuA domain-containing protein [Pseudomonadota bacterium]
MKKKVLVVSAGIVHPSLLARFYLRRLLKKLDRFEFVFSTRVEDLNRLGDGGFAAVVLYFHRKQISDDALRHLEDFVGQGGGLLALHSASASFKQNTRYFDLIGGRFKTHGPIEDFVVRPSQETSELFSNIPEFTVKDELYIHEYQNDVTVHFTTQNGDATEPVVWTKAHGRGKVGYFSLGHCAKVITAPEVGRIILRLLEWMVQ